MAHDILVVDDEADIRGLIADILRDEGYSCREAANSSEALGALADRLPSLMVLDIWLQGSEMDGLQILEAMKQHHGALPVIMISGHADIETAVGAIKIGAYDFIEKPFKADRLLLMVERAVDTARLRRENAELRERVGEEPTLWGVSTEINQLRHVIERVAPTESRVLITGPAGVGKEVVARQLHSGSHRKDGPFVAVNCATMAPETMEVELFGSEEGGNGVLRSIGTFEQADGGTLLLDDISDMPIETQGKIVRVLQEQTFQRVGGVRQVDVDVRVIASTNKNLRDEMAAGRFREDLYYRLSVVPIPVPPLVVRPNDIPPLVSHFMDRARVLAGLPTRVIAEDAMVALQGYSWPGNVRQLRNVVEWILIMAGDSSDDPIRIDMLPPEILGSTPAALRWEEGGEVMGLPLRDARDLFEKEYLRAQISRFGGNVSRTAKFIGMERSALHRKLKMLGVTGEKAEENSVG
jgi:two-component system nitrogen regulation response regulator NtrX